MRPSPWLQCPARKSDPHLRVFFFHHAGGSAATFYPWCRRLPPQLEGWTIELPGRGVRGQESPLREMPAVVHPLRKALLPWLDKPFVLFGHSLGSVVAFELARSLEYGGLPIPYRLFLSAISAPNHRERTSNVAIDTLSDADFLREVTRYGPLPTEILTNPELLAIVMTYLRADFALSNSYRYIEGPALTAPITVIGGMNDSTVSEEALEAWRSYSCGSFRRYMFPGDHFFLHKHIDRILEIMISSLRSLSLR